MNGLTRSNAESVGRDTYEIFVNYLEVGYCSLAIFL